jgi:predicted permease
MCVVLLVGAGLFVRSLQRVSAMRLGYDVDPVLFVRVNLRGAKLTSDELLALDDRLLTEARGVPGVTHATTAVSVPLSYNEGRALFVDGVDSVERLGHFVMQAGTPDYFATVGTRVLRGRAFDASDRSTSPPVVVVSEGMARVLWPGQEPLGRCIRIRLKTSPCSTVIGVAEDIRARSLTDAREHSYYVPAAQVGPSASFLVRTAGDASDYAATVRRRLQQILPRGSYATVAPLRTLVDPSFRNWRFGATMFGAFGALALALAALGLYAVVAHNVAQRRQEIGVRIALGASRAAVVRLFVGRGLRLVLAGVAVGSVLALLGGRLVEPLLFRVSPNDPVVFGLVALVLIGVGLVAAAVPSVGASAVDPNVALRFN